MINIYIASPLGFTESTRSFMDTLEDMIASCGYTVHNPWRMTDPELFRLAAAIQDTSQRWQALRQANSQTAATNEQAIRDCDRVVAVLDGPDVDSGTASEIGFAYAVGKRIYGYRGDSRLTGDNEAAVVNLQVEYWIENSGGCILRDLDSLQRLLGKAIKE